MMTDQDRAITYCRRAAALTGKGEFDEAAATYLRVLELEPDNTTAHIFLSAIRFYCGETELAESMLREGVRRKPFIIKQCRKEPTARILRVRGVEKSRYTLGRDGKGQYKIKLSGGNFSDTHLTDMDRYETVNFLVRDNNILSCPDIPEFNIIINSIADPDVELKSLATMAEFLRRRGSVPLINHPDRVAETSRDKNYLRLGGIDGIIFPKTVRLTVSGMDGRALINAVAENGFTYPFLVREPGSQTGRTFSIITAPHHLTAYAEERQAEELYFIRYVESLFLGSFFRKMRFFCVDGQLYPVVCHIDVKWNVHGENRAKIMKQNEWMMEDEKSFLADSRNYIGHDQYECLKGLYKLVGLDYFGIDFDITDDGRILIFELNPAMRHHFGHARKFPYLTPHLQAVTDAFNRMIDRKIG